MSNPFTDLQARLSELLLSNAYFTGVTIITEDVADIENEVAQKLLPLGFGIVITTAKGNGSSSLGSMRSRETLVIALTLNPTLEPNRKLLDALYQAQIAVIGKPLKAGRVIRDEEDCFRYESHERRTDAPPELHVHHLFVTGKVIL